VKFSSSPRGSPSCEPLDRTPLGEEEFNRCTIARLQPNIGVTFRTPGKADTGVELFLVGVLGADVELLPMLLGS